MLYWPTWTRGKGCLVFSIIYSNLTCDKATMSLGLSPRWFYSGNTNLSKIGSQGELVLKPRILLSKSMRNISLIYWASMIPIIVSAFSINSLIANSFGSSRASTISWEPSGKSHVVVHIKGVHWHVRIWFTHLWFGELSLLWVVGPYVLTPCLFSGLFTHMYWLYASSCMCWYY